MTLKSKEYYSIARMTETLASGKFISEKRCCSKQDEIPAGENVLVCLLLFLFSFVCLVTQYTSLCINNSKLMVFPFHLICV